MAALDSKHFSRRRFLKGLAAAAPLLTAPAAVRAAALGRGASVAPSERITLGFIGIGMMGRGHLGIALNTPDVQVLGVCDVDAWRRDTALNRVEKTYAARNKAGKDKSCKAYNDLRDMLARTDMDAVYIATGDRWHVPAGVMAIKSGKDVYCEKPMSLTLHEARTMIDVTRRYGGVFQVGLQQRSTPEFQKATQLVRDGRLGKVSHVYVGFPGTSGDIHLPSEPVPKTLDWDLWLGPAPWRPFNGRFHHTGQPRHVVPWHISRDFGAGNLTSNAVHAFDVVQWGLGMDNAGPVKITPPETGKVPSLTYEYPGGAILQVTWKLEKGKHYIPKGWNLNERLQNFGALFVGEKGWIHVGRAHFLKAYPQSILDGEGVKGLTHSPVVAHHRDFYQAIRTRRRPSCDVEFGGRSAMVSHLGCIAHWTGRAQTWDPVKEAFLDDEPANRFRARSFRSPWRL